jgi:alanyl-tRNA synthetase
VTTTVTTMPEAIAQGADAIFDEKYGEVVRLVQVPGYSRELCGGTHCRATGQIGWFFITAERSIGSGLRRIEAVTGEAAEALVADRFRLLDAAVERLGVTDPSHLPVRAAELQERVRELERRMREGGSGIPRPKELAARAETIGGATVVAFAAPFESAEDLKSRARDVRGIIGSGVIAFALEGPEPLLFVTVSDDLVVRGVSASRLVQDAVTPIEGRGGGRPEMAQARGSRGEGVAESLDLVRRAVERALEGPVGAPAAGSAGAPPGPRPGGSA